MRESFLPVGVTGSRCYRHVEPLVTPRIRLGEAQITISISQRGGTRAVCKSSGQCMLPHTLQQRRETPQTIQRDMSPLPAWTSPAQQQRREHEPARVNSGSWPGQGARGRRRIAPHPSGRVVQVVSPTHSFLVTTTLVHVCTPGEVCCVAVDKCSGHQCGLTRGCPIGATAALIER